MTITKNGKEYLTFKEKLDLLVKMSCEWDMGKIVPAQQGIEGLDDYKKRVEEWTLEMSDIEEQISLWIDEMEELGHIGYPKDKFRGVEDL